MVYNISLIIALGASMHDTVENIPIIQLGKELLSQDKTQEKKILLGPGC